MFFTPFLERLLSKYFFFIVLRLASKLYRFTAAIAIATFNAIKYARIATTEI